MMFEACSKPWLIERMKNLLLYATTGGGHGSTLGTVVSALTKATVFRHFCAGETISDCVRVAKEMEQNRISIIVDHSKEEAEGEWQVSDGIEVTASCMLSSLVIDSDDAQCLRTLTIVCVGYGRQVDISISLHRVRQIWMKKGLFFPVYEKA